VDLAAVTLELAFRSGARAGQREAHTRPVVTIGRHPSCDVRFDAQRDLDVSARHAEVRLADGAAILADLGSTNGTFVNGARIAGPTPLADGDVVRFGADGPELVVGLPRGGSTAPTPGRASRADAVPPETRAHRTPHAGSTQVRVAAAVRQETRRLAGLFTAAVLGVAALGGGAWWWQKRAGDARAAQLATLLARQDSLAQALEAQLARVQGTVIGLDSALQAARLEAGTLRRDIAAGGDPAALRARVAEAEARQARLLGAARTDFAAVAQANGAAVALVAVEMPDGRAFSGTGFAVDAEGRVVTNRHLVQDADGTRARRLAVIFADTREWRPARLVRAADTEDLALLQVGDGAPTPAVVGLADAPPRVGAPVALMGYPLGIETPMEGSGTRITARATLGAGTVGKVLDEVLQVDAFASQGSSGSPVFDAEGRVVGVVYGGAAESGGRIVYAVPLARLRAFLAAPR
jgi:S1-C subfamily serine protease